MKTIILCLLLLIITLIMLIIVRILVIVITVIISLIIVQEVHEDLGRVPGLVAPEPVVRALITRYKVCVSYKVMVV